MSPASPEAALLDVLAAFAGALTAPLLAGLVLVAGIALRPARLARLAAAALGLAHGGLELALEARPTVAPALLLGSLAAAWLMVELVLQILLPSLRLARRILAALARRLG